MGRASKIHIDKQALIHNLGRVREISPHSRTIAMVKANAYGHGLGAVAHALSAHTDAFGVACIEEGLTLRRQGIDTPIVLLEGFFSSDELPLIVEHNFSIVLHCSSQLQTLLDTSLGKPIDVWIKLDTGMHRLGFSVDELSSLWHSLAQCYSVDNIRLMTHFACADEIDSHVTTEQMAQFFHATEPFDTEKSLANSAGIIGWPKSHQDWVRPGLMLYGISPFADKVGADLGLKAVMQFDSEVIAVHRYPKGAAIGYGGRDVCQRESLVAVVAVGYGDGYPRHAAKGTPVLVGGQPVPLFGRVSMDMLTVDVTDISVDCQVGTEVTLWGKNLAVETVARHADTIPYELCCHITDRVRTHCG